MVVVGGLKIISECFMLEARIVGVECGLNGCKHLGYVCYFNMELGIKICKFEWLLTCWLLAFGVWNCWCKVGLNGC